VKNSPLLDQPQRTLIHDAFKYRAVVNADGGLVVAVFGMETDIALYNEMLNVMLHELLAVLRHPSDNRNPL